MRNKKVKFWGIWWVRPNAILWTQTTTIMTCGNKIAWDVHYIVIQLSAIVGPDKIAFYTGISRWSVQCILNYFTMHGTSIEPEKEHKSSNKYLCDMDLSVWVWVVIGYRLKYPSTRHPCPMSPRATCVSSCLLSTKKTLDVHGVSFFMTDNFGGDRLKANTSSYWNHRSTMKSSGRHMTHLAIRVTMPCYAPS